MKLFVSNPDWTRVAIYVAAVTALWAAVQEVLPDAYVRIGSAVLLGITNAIAILARGGRYVEDRADKPTLHDPAGK